MGRFPKIAAITIPAFFLASCWMIAGLDKTGLPQSDADTDADDGGSDSEAGECTESSQCDDGEPCNGEEDCSADGACVEGTPLDDGTECSTDTVTEGACDDSVCVSVNCGNGDKEPGEECDDGNDVSDDGCRPDCTYSCRDIGDCDNSDPCRRQECVANEAGQLCVKTFTRSKCEDGLFCTKDDRCNGEGECVGGDDACNDGRPCTDDFCEEGEDGPDCHNELRPDSCFIDGRCYADGSPNPSNACEECNSRIDFISWSWKPDMDGCAGGKCCGGQCRVGGDCCSPWDCDEICRGMPMACVDLDNPVDCDEQAGCDWAGASCRLPGPVDLCRRIETREDCLVCGCTWNSMHLPACYGDPFACDYHEIDDICWHCDCTWADGPCEGTAASCRDMETAADCIRQDGCFWERAPCMDFSCID